MNSLESVKNDIADLLIDVAKRRSLEAAKRRRQQELDAAKRAIELSKPKEIERRVMA